MRVDVAGVSVHAAHAHVSRRLHDTHVKVAARRGWQGVVLPVLLGVVRALWVALSAVGFAVVGVAQGSGVAVPARTGAARAAGTGTAPKHVPEPVLGTAGRPIRPTGTSGTRKVAPAPVKPRVAPPAAPTPMAPTPGGPVTAGIDIDPEAAASYAGLNAALDQASKSAAQSRGMWADGVDAASGVRLDPATLGALAGVGDAFDALTGALTGAQQALQAAHSAIHEAVQANGGHMAAAEFYQEG